MALSTLVRRVPLLLLLALPFTGCDCGAPPAGGTCGDGTVDPGEQCDDGDTTAGDGCSAACKDEAPSPACGDGTVDPGEDCDDGDTTAGDGCSATCTTEPEPPACGDGTLDPGEQCDDGDTTAGDGCSATCTTEPPPPACGDGTVDPGEQCDDGGTVAGDGCSAACTTEPPPPSCGDGTVTAPEQCDDGANLDGDGCSAACLIEIPAGCGDGTVTAPEQCDDGANLDGDGCSAVCVVEIPAGCGDGTMDPGEECDDGGNLAGDGCSAACTLELPPTCGNTALDPGEQCDDGANIDGDGCSAACALEAGASCGDGQTDPGEQCDDGAHVDGDGCEANCTLTLVSTCGDGALDVGEQCDDGGNLGGDGCAANCFDEPGGFDLTDADPRVASRVTGAAVTVFGAGLLGPLTVALEDCLDPDAPPVLLTPVGVDPGGLSAAFTLDPDPAIPQSLYRLAGTNGDGQHDVTDCLFVVSAQPPPTVTDVSPPFAFAGVADDGVLSDATVQVRGTGFAATPAVTFVSTTDATVTFQAPLVAFTSDTDLTVVAPSESERMPVGGYFVLVTNPDGLQAQLLVPDGAGGLVPGVFEVRSVPPPTITNVDPPRDPGTAEVTLTITGRDLQAGAVASLVLDQQGAALALATTFVDDHTLTAVIPGNAVSDGIYPVKVVHPDGQFDVFFVYEQTNSSAGHLNSGNFVDAGRGLVVPRERHGAVEGFDAFGQSHLYVVGGLDAQHAVLGSVERAQVSLFGDASAFELARQYQGPGDDQARATNDLVTPRAGLALVRAGAFLYALGGTTSDPLGTADAPALSSIERARILGFESQPFIGAPHVLGGNGLAAGTWFYRVSSLSADGESLASREVVARGGGHIRVCWGPVAGATAYNVYRSPAADGRFGTTRLLAPDLAVAPSANGQLCLEDDGRDDAAAGRFLTPAPGRLAGSPVSGGALPDGVYRYRVAAVKAGRETVAGNPAALLVDAVQGPGLAAIALRWDVIPGATYRLYRSPAADDPAGAERLLATDLATNSFVDDGAVIFAGPTVAPRDGVAVLPAGSLSRWRTLPVTLTRPREGGDAVVLTLFDGDPLTTADPSFLYLTGGKTAHQAGTYLASTERARIDGATGDLVNPDDPALTTLAEDTVHLMSAGRAWFPLLTNQGQLVTPFPPPAQEPPCGDLDGDGHVDASCGGDDCDDGDAAVHPGADEACSDGRDDDCDGKADCDDLDEAPAGCAASLECSCDPAVVDADGDAHLAAPRCGDDCDDLDPAVHGGAVEACSGGVDEDCDLQVDCFDPDCAADPACTCGDVVDGDGDGELATPCGGDCDDTDPTICTACAEVQCDGLDQDCSGNDRCFTTGAVGSGGGTTLTTLGAFGATRGGFGATALAPESTDPVFLFAVAGDKNFSPTGNSGSKDLEATQVDRATGALLGWSVQGQSSLSGQGSLGHDALLYFNFLFSFPGATGESLGQPPSIDGSTVTRFPVDEEAATVAGILGSRQSASTKLTVPRAYAVLVRLNARIFALGGNDGTGPSGVVDVHAQ